MPPRGTKQTLSPTVTPPWNQVQQKRQTKKSVQDLHKEAMENGFEEIEINGLDGTLTSAQVIRIQNRLKDIDERANKLVGGRIDMSRKPFFKFVSIREDGTVEAKGGGFLMYIGWNQLAEKDDPRYRKNSKGHLKGMVPVFIGGRSPVKGPNPPKFSVQLNTVKTLYVKEPVEEKVRIGNYVITKKS